MIYFQVNKWKIKTKKKNMFNNKNSNDISNFNLNNNINKNNKLNFETTKQIKTKN